MTRVDPRPEKDADGGWERGEAKTQHATQAAFDALADHLDIE